MNCKYCGEKCYEMNWRDWKLWDWTKNYPWPFQELIRIADSKEWECLPTHDELHQLLAWAGVSNNEEWHRTLDRIQWDVQQSSRDDTHYSSARDAVINAVIWAVLTVAGGAIYDGFKGAVLRLWDRIRSLRAKVEVSVSRTVAVQVAKAAVRARCDLPDISITPLVVSGGEGDQWVLTFHVPDKGYFVVVVPPTRCLTGDISVQIAHD
jgi:hypothetical protein